MSGHNVMTGDCCEILAAMPRESVDLIVTDPPYNIGIDYGSGKKADRRIDYDVWCQRWIGLCYRVLRAGGSIWIVSGQEHGADIDIALRNAEFSIRNRITWHETFGVYCHNKFGRCSRPIFYAVKGDGFVFNKEAVTVPSARQTKYNDKRANPGGKIMGDVWEVPRVCGTFKERVEGVPTQLPEELASRMIGVSSNFGQCVLDPFAGSGTIPAVAASLGRVAVGIELNAAYAEIARSRIARAASDAEARTA